MSNATTCRARRERRSARPASGRCRAGPGPPIRPRHVHGEVGGVPRPQAGNHRAAAGRPGRRGRPRPQRDLDLGTPAPGSPVHRYRLDRESAAQAARPALPRREDRTAEQLVAEADLEPRDRKRVQFFLENLAEAFAPSNVPLVNPASAKAVIDTAGLSLVRGGKQLVKRHGLGTAHSGDGRRQRVRRGREHRRDAGRGRVSQRGVGADPVRAADRGGLRGAGAGGPAHDQQVLRDRPRPGTEPGRARRAAGQADVRHLLAQPGLTTRLLEPRHLRACGPRRPGRRRGDHRQRADGACWSVLRRHPREHRQRRTWPGSAGRTGWPRSAWRSRSSTTRTPGRRPPWSTSGWRAWPRRSRRARATSTAGRWPRCSRGCGPATWCGTTGSTTTCSASDPRRSTSCSGTPTPPG